MKNGLLITAGLLGLLSTAQAQTTKLGSAGNKANYGTTNPRPKIGSGSMGSTTVDGSNGSATNDGASGQSGSPAPLPPASANQTAAQRKESPKPKRVAPTANGTSAGRGKRF